MGVQQGAELYAGFAAGAVPVDSRRYAIPSPTACGRSAALLALALASCGGGAERQEPIANAPDAAIDARSYVASFVTEDAEACFGDVQMTQPSLEGKDNASLAGVTPLRVVVAVDGSGSMAGQLSGRTKLEMARSAALGFVDGLPASVEASLLVFGQQGSNDDAGKARSCAGIDMLAPMSSDRAGLVGGVRRLKAVGWTPLAMALERAESLLQASSVPGEQLIYVVSDGEETCGGDPVAVARRINAGKTRAVINVIGFGLPAPEAAALKAVADAGGGNFVNLANQTDYDRTMQAVREANRHARNAARISDADKRNALQVSEVAGKASQCVSDIVAGESRRLSDDMDARWKRNASLPFSTEALKIQQARHHALLKRSEDLTRKLLEREYAARAQMKNADAAAR
ncbi:VWA domain-containing protein [Sphingomonas psychrotolerans]|uniref:VWA domain-containing protein n=1 Tax=Sphingomonas psychrotolerans TaxID=1327635 RepID=A0ABU3N2A4_9SPHN|nr:VWA domain-containing protein [Sphingomonas psychrotolerans]MDT8758680.1 VWA domain-containing protein [Sphingomonas psychrotolerans]